MKGAEAEALAATWLTQQGREILRRNYRIPGGEIDIVSRDAAGRLHFTEVRWRTRQTHGSAAESVTPRKLALMHRAALSYLTRELGRDDVACSLEVLTLQGSLHSGEWQLWPVTP
ncbi:YraN family protein [Deinococcus lacus]|uniref:UPF0102 protein ACFP81_11025 n=1 Tax=Deinococcus lacus TaxID=392561 RepID=A0ABW1YEM4_9DEIO